MTADIVRLPVAEAVHQPGLDIKTAATRIRALNARISFNMILIGLELIAVKKALGHGEFGGWVKAEFGWSGRTARRFMQAAEVFGAKVDTVSVLDPSALYLLSAPSTPDQVRKYALALLEGGRALPAAEIRKLCSGNLAGMPSLKESIAAWEMALRKAGSRRRGVKDYVTQVDNILIEIAAGKWIPKPPRPLSMAARIQVVAWVTIMREACWSREHVMELVDLAFPAPPARDHAAPQD